MFGLQYCLKIPQDNFQHCKQGLLQKHQSILKPQNLKRINLKRHFYNMFNLIIFKYN